MTLLREIKRGWETAAQADAMFNILTTAGKENGGWDHGEFFANGQREIWETIDRLEELSLLPASRGRALDFGCGVGRLTQALAERYEQVDGVDISRSMVTQARRHAQRRGCVNCTFHVNNRADLSLFEDGSFDLIYSVITLQHMPHRLQRSYIREFVRLIKPDGLAVFQVPEGGTMIQQQEWLSMYGASRDLVEGWAEQAGGKVHTVEPSHHAGDGWVGWLYIVGRSS